MCRTLLSADDGSKTERRWTHMEITWDLGEVDESAEEFDVLMTKSY
ncbi:hypothetical protein ACTMTI_53685 [Nonomuraea sp. H19]